MIFETGGVLSLDFVAGVSPGWIPDGCTPMSANRFTVACWRLGAGGTSEPPS